MVRISYLKSAVMRVHHTMLVFPLSLEAARISTTVVGCYTGGKTTPHITHWPQRAASSTHSTKTHNVPCTCGQQRRCYPEVPGQPQHACTPCWQSRVLRAKSALIAPGHAPTAAAQTACTRTQGMPCTKHSCSTATVHNYAHTALRSVQGRTPWCCHAHARPCINHSSDQ